MYLDDLLDGHKRQQLDAHLSSCSRCREEIEQMRAVTRSLNALPKVSSSDSFDLVLQARLRQQIRQEVPNHTIRWLPFFENLKAPSFAVAAVLLMFIGAMLHRFYGTPQAQPQFQVQGQGPAATQDFVKNVSIADPGYMVVAHRDTVNNRIVIINYVDIDNITPARDTLLRRARLSSQQNNEFPDLKQAPPKQVRSIPAPAHSNRPRIQYATEYRF